MHRKLYRAFYSQAKSCIHPKKIKDIYIKSMSQLDQDASDLEAFSSNSHLFKQVKEKIQNTIDAVIRNLPLYQSDNQQYYQIADKNIRDFVTSTHETIAKMINIYDSTTWLLNKNYLSEWEKLWIKNYTIFFLDLDNLKEVNDRYWHIKWDELLKSTSGFCKSIVREWDDFIVRFWWDEILLLVSSDNTEVVNRIIANIEESNMPISFGVATSIEWGSLKEIVDIADKRMYQMKSKKKQKNNSVVAA